MAGQISRIQVYVRSPQTLSPSHRLAYLDPVLLFGRDFWQRMVNFEGLVEKGVISAEDLEIFQYVESAEQAYRAIQDFYPPEPG